MLNARLVRWLSRKTPSAQTNADISLPVVLATDVGLIRNENQDRVAALRVNTTSANGQTFAVIAVSDGMGGMRDGAECATRAISALFHEVVRFRNLPPKDRIERAVESANTLVHEYAGGKGGATLSALLVTADQGAWIANVGDSRVYGVEGKESQKVIRLTVDDTLEEAVGGHGRELLQFIGMGPGMRPHISKVSSDIDRVLISSDGVHFIAPEMLCDTFLNVQSNFELAEQLLAIARWRGAPDNASLAAISLTQLISELPKTDESGVEVWDAFTGLHVMWLPLVPAEESDSPQALHVQSNDNRPFYHKADDEPFYSENDDEPFYPADEDNSVFVTLGEPKEGSKGASKKDENILIEPGAPKPKVPTKNSRAKTSPSTKKASAKKPPRSRKASGTSALKKNAKKDSDLQLSLVDKQQED